jgi:hypothetical protein
MARLPDDVGQIDDQEVGEVLGAQAGLVEVVASALRTEACDRSTLSIAIIRLIGLIDVDALTC